MTIEQCYECKYANEYLLLFWYPLVNPTCLKGEPMYTDTECEKFELIGRRSR